MFTTSNLRVVCQRRATLTTTKSVAKERHLVRTITSSDCGPRKMANPKEETADAITEEEMRGIAGATSTSNKPKNAFSELMSPKKPKPNTKRPSNTATPSANRVLDTSQQRNLNATHGRDALIAYTTSPTSFPSSRVLSHNKDFVLIHDLYPKSSIHLLLLPRDPAKQLLHPFVALDGTDPAFLASVKHEVAQLRKLAASELRRRHGRLSKQDAARNAFLDSPPEKPAEPPPGRDWEKEILSGVHAHPSMNHLHIHILSVDRVSECMRHRKHYNSFATPFLVPVEDFPLEEDDVRRHPGREGYLERDLVCWRCGRGFGNKFARLKEHLDEEFDGWVRE